MWQSPRAVLLNVKGKKEPTDCSDTSAPFGGLEGGYLGWFPHSGLVRPVPAGQAITRTQGVLGGGDSRMSFTRTLIRIGVQSVDSLVWLAIPWWASCGYHRGRRPSLHSCHSNENPDLGIVLGTLFKAFD